MENFNEWIKVIEHSSFNKVYNYLLIDKKNLLFDISFNQVARLVKDFPPDFLVISHFHLDHQTGKVRLKRKYNTKIIAHELEVDSIERRDGFSENYNKYNGKELVKRLHFIYWGFKSSKVEIKVKDDQVINIGDHELKVIHTPGTTPGHICLFEVNEKILLAGDIGPLELPIYNAITSSVIQYMKSYDKLINLKPKIILSAHFAPLIGENKIVKAYKKAELRFVNRERKILELINEKNLTLEEIAMKSPTIKNKPSESIMKKWLIFAEKIQVMHHLEKLKLENKIKSNNKTQWSII